MKPEGQFTSPNYPNNYPRDTHCQWVIQVEYGHLIEITFTDFDFEASQDCKQDGLIVRVKTFHEFFMITINNIFILKSFRLCFF